MERFYTQLAPLYDTIYRYIDCRAQAGFFGRVIKENNRSGSRALLDMACGTGTHATLLQKQGYRVTGLDKSRQMLAVARQKSRAVRWVQGDMGTFSLPGKFGAILCAFNSIQYARSLARTLRNAYRHLAPGGVLIFEAVDKAIGDGSWETYEYRSRPRITLRVRWALRRKLELDIVFTVGRKEIPDHHVLEAFTLAEMKQLAERAGFAVEIRNKPWAGRPELEAVFVCRTSASTSSECSGRCRT